MRGRKPKPSVIKLASGNPGRRPLPVAEADPAPLDDLNPPGTLSDAAQGHWRDLAGKLADAGLLTSIDATAFALLCESLATLAEAQRGLRAHGLLVKSGSNNAYPLVSPYLSIARNAQKQVASLLVEFGLTPSSRSRVTITPKAVRDRSARAKRFFGA